MSTASTPFISVIIPTFNRLELLKETVDSVRAQTFRDIEIIVVNDGCTDGTGGWLDSQDDLRHIDQENSGIAASRNRGAAAARGQWLAFLDHDDLWARDKLEIQADFVKKHPEVGLAAAKHVRLGKGFRDTRESRWIEGDLFVKVFSESFIHTSSVMIRRDVFEQVGGFPTNYRFADEFDVWLKISARYNVAYVDDPLVFIRFYESNTSHNRIGVRSDTYRILLSNYDPLRIPRRVFLETMSDHDISFGRAYVREGDLEEALRWFRRSVERTPFRFRSLRYYLRYRLAAALRGDPNRGKAADNRCRFKTAPRSGLAGFSEVEIDPQASAILDLEPRELGDFFGEALQEHERLLAASKGSGARPQAVRKDAPESAVTLVDLPGRPRVCVKEFRWRGFAHALKGILRNTQGRRTFSNGGGLSEEGIGTAHPLVLVRNKRLGLVTREWVVMEVIPDAVELDRHILRMLRRPDAAGKRTLARELGRFIGSLHARCIFHADLKTCNILVSDLGSRAEGPRRVRGPGRIRFDLIDYDSVIFGTDLPFRKRVKNLVQIFLSTPVAMGPKDRMRFLRAYASASGLDRSHARRLARDVLQAARGREILYVGFEGDIVEKWEQ